MTSNQKKSCRSGSVSRCSCAAKPDPLPDGSKTPATECRTYTHRYLVGGLLILSLLPTAHAGEGALNFQDGRANYFAGTTSVCRVETVGLAGLTLSWNVTANGRTLNAGDVAVEADGVVGLPMNLPALDPGIVMEAALVLSAGNGGGATNLHQRVWLFSQDAFHLHTKHLRDVGLKLYDNVGQTAPLFDSAGLEYEALKSVDQLARVDSGLVVVGFGHDLDGDRGLKEAMVVAATAGAGVLCLAPAGGAIELSSATGSPEPASVKMEKAGIVKALDKRLDEPGVGSGMTLTALRDSVRGIFSEQGDWPWVELRYGTGWLVICGFDLTETWHEGPAPRYLLLNILQHLESDKE